MTNPIIIEDDMEPLSLKNTQVIEKCELIVKKPDMLGNSKWEMVFAAQSVLVKIKPQDFIKDVHKGKISITGKVKIICDLEIKTIADESYENIKAEYTILNVHGVEYLSNPEQTELF